ncbi:MAG: IS1634 family transposase [Verrucomicrobiae bacterium]|nr:IS1634 family transposase [Verrucomicrobiae bacterium]
MFLRHTRRWKDGKEHLYWSLVENRRCGGTRVVQHTVLYLGEINDSQKEQWIRAIEVFDEDCGSPDQLKLFAAERPLPADAPDGVQVRLRDFELHRPRQWGGCWLFTEVWKELGLDRCWRERLGKSREGTDWEHVLQTLCAYRLLDPGSEWRLHRVWFDQSAMADLLGEDFSLAAKDTLYRGLDHLVEHKGELFTFLRQRWQDLFGVKFEVLLYDLTSTYFESDPPFPEKDPRRFGYSRDKRSDCVQVVIALVITPEGFPLAYEMMPGNTADKTTLRGFLQKIETLYGKAQRIWIMDRGIPTEAVLAEMRAADPPVLYLVGTPKGRLSALEQELLEVPWQQTREGVDVKLVPSQGELYVLARSKDRVAKERAMRRRQLKELWTRLAELKRQEPKRDALLLKLGAAKAQGPLAWKLVTVEVSAEGTLQYSLRKDRLRERLRREGRYLLRSNLTGKDPAQIWHLYMLLVQVEEAFRNLKGDLSIRPVYHQLPERIEAHILVAFLAFCLHTTLRHKLRQKAPGLTPRSLIEQLSALQMLDVHFPTTDGRTLLFQRYTSPNKTQKLLLAQLGLELPPQSPPRISSHRAIEPLPGSAL